MYTSFINEPSEIHVYDPWCHIDVQPEAVLLLQWMGNWLGGFFNHYLSSETWISTHLLLFRVIVLDSQRCLVRQRSRFATYCRFWWKGPSCCCWMSKPCRRLDWQDLSERRSPTTSSRWLMPVEIIKRYLHQLRCKCCREQTWRWYYYAL